MVPHESFSFKLLIAAALAVVIDTRVPAGVWGGQHVGLTVTEAGAHLEFDCATGDIEKPLVVDGLGRVDMTGTWTSETGGPVRSDGKPERRPVRYTGRVDGRTMTLDVTLVEPPEKIGSYSLELGREPILRKCR